MKKIHIIARFKINGDKLNDFKAGSEKCVSLVKKNEHGALLYDWFIDEANLDCTVIETYQDSVAVLAHVGNVNEELSKLMEISTFSGEVFGNASPELTSALKDMGIVPVPYVNGI